MLQNYFPPRSTILGGILIAALTLLVYAPSLGNGFALLDDGLLIYENNAIREISPATLKAAFTNYDPELYVPLTIFSYQIDYLIGGYHPFMYHFTNLLLHALSSLLVSWITLTLTKRKLIALFVGLLFAIHPLHTETVAWAAARKDVLSAFFFLAAFASYLSFLKRFERKTNNEQTNNESAIGKVRPMYLLSLFLFLLGLLSKVTVLTLPFVLILTEWFLLVRPARLPLEASRSGAKWGALALRTLPFFALSFLFGLIALGGKTAILGAVSPLEKILLAGKSVFFVLGKLFFPVSLSPFYPQLSPIHLSDPFLFLALLFTVLLSLITLFLLLNRERIQAESSMSRFQYTSILKRASAIFRKNQPTLKMLSYGWLFFLVTLAPTFMTPSKGGENVYITSDRYAYLPSIGILLIVGMMLTHILEHSEDARVQVRRMKSIFLGVGAIVCIFAFLTLQQSLLWGNNVALFAHAAAVSPDFYFAHINHGAALRLERQHEKAAEAFWRAIALRPLGNTYGLLAQVLAEQSRLEEAITEFQKGVALSPEDYELHHGLGQVYSLQGKFEDALAEYERALALMPETKNAYEKLSRRIGARRDVVLMRIGILYGERGDHERAIEYYERALEENPSFADAHFNLAVGLGNLGKKEEALAHYEEAVRLEPTHIRARVNLAMMYAEKGRKQEAKVLLQAVLRDDPKNTVAKNALEQLKYMR